MPGKGSQAYNRYSYVLGNPINLIDTGGHSPQLPPPPPPAPPLSDPPPAGPPTPPTPPPEGTPEPPNDDEENVDHQLSEADITEWLANVLAGELRNIEIEYEFSACDSIHSADVFFWMIMIKHLDLFGSGSKYDIKVDMGDEIGSAVTLCGNEGCQWVDYSAPGNILFGYLSSAAGVPQAVSWQVGGLLESLDGGFKFKNWSSWFDNPGDKAAVNFGYELYEKYPNGITYEEFQSELTTDALNSFQQPPKYPSSDPVSSGTNFSYDQFFNP